MKRYIRASTIPDDIIKTAISYASSGDKGTIIDRDNHRIDFVCSKGVSESFIMEEGMLGDWYAKNGFDVSFDVKDVPYDTKARTKEGYRFGALGSNIPSHTAYLRNRLVMTITW